MLKWFRRQKPAAAEEQWAIATTEEDGARVLYRVRQQPPAGIDPSRYAGLINIYWRFDGEWNEGMPPSDVYDRMAALEEALEPLDGPETGFFVVSITGNNRKEWAWYVADPAAFMERVNVALAGSEPFPVEFETAADPGWQNFHELLRRFAEAERGGR